MYRRLNLKAKALKIPEVLCAVGLSEIDKPISFRYNKFVYFYTVTLIMWIIFPMNGIGGYTIIKYFSTYFHSLIRKVTIATLGAQIVKLNIKRQRIRFNRPGNHQPAF